jgi:hypothetical protein
LFRFSPPTTHGQRRPSNVPPPSPHHLRFQLPSPSCILRHADVTPFLMCSGLMVVGHCLDCYSLLSVVFAVFHGHPVTVPSLRTSSHFPHAHPPDAHPSNSALCDALLARVSPSVVSLQSPSRTALIVSLLRYVAFLFRHLVCLVPSDGGQGHVYQKALRAKSKKIHRTNILHPHLPSTSPLYPTPTTYSHPCSLAHQPPTTRLRIAYINAGCGQLLRFQLRWTTPPSWRSRIIRDFLGLGQSTQSLL